MTVTVKIITERKTNTIVIPNTAMQTQSGTTIVQVKNPDGTMTSKKVVTGISDGAKTEILTGLTIGEFVFLETYIAPTSSKESAI